MPASFSLIASIARADVVLRFRKTTTIVILLIIAGSMYLIIPDVSTGNTLIQVDGARVIYNSEAIALGTAMTCSALLSIIGYYLVSNSLKRDILSRVGFIAAATPVTNAEYVLGKFFGNLLYLFGVMLACMVSAMLMFFVRGETFLNPFVFFEIYLWMILPGIVFCSATAIAFESLPKLSGRAGDLLFFFLWAFMLSFPAIMLENHPEAWWVQGLDMVGIVQVIHLTQENFHTTSMSIGFSEYDIAKAPIEFPGLVWSWSNVVFRMFTLIVPMVFVVLAWAGFHRFNPTRIKSSARHAGSNLLTRMNAMVKPLTRALEIVASFRTQEKITISFLNTIRADVVTTLASSPITTVAIIIFACISLFLDTVSLRSGVLPVVVVTLILALSDIATRDHSSGMMSLLFTVPMVKRNYVFWKFSSAFIVTLCFTLIPMSRLLFVEPMSAVSLFIGSCFIASGATGLGILTHSRKAFIGVFLMLLYVTLNSPKEPALDFAGFYGMTTPVIQLMYALITLAIIAAAEVRFRFAIRH
ncbi:MAG: hypothetical protein EPO24_00600 [Bacteroidetes bacterium]|nr:MAG: hypothetical protein EPO24_00600 [Bacteroidota bacterium]